MSTRKRIQQLMRTSPKRYQVRGVRAIERHEGRVLLGDDMGLGKTYQVIAYLMLHPEVRPVAIVSPATLKYVWVEQFHQHCRRPPPVWVAEGRKAGHLSPRGGIWIINYDILDAWLPVLANRVAAIVIDECQMVKNRKAKRTMACRAIARQCRWVIPMSGTPITNRPVEFFPSLQMIAPKEFNSFWEYAFQYCDPKRGFRGRGWDFGGASNLEELHAKASRHMIRRTKAEVLPELPCKVRSSIPVDLDNWKEYTKAVENFVSWLLATEGEGAVKRASGAVGLVRMGKLRHLAGVGKAKAVLRWVREWLEANDGKIVIFGLHIDVLNLLEQGIRKGCCVARVDGGVSLLERQKAVDRFQNEPRCRVFLGNMQAAGVGLTLTASSTVVFAELGWTPAEHDQAEDRVLRIGQKSNVVDAHYFVGRGTIEEDVMQTLEDKQKVVSQVVDGIAEADVRARIVRRLLKGRIVHE